jgi:cytochrome o ubiquinol oxidase subunit 1
LKIQIRLGARWVLAAPAVVLRCLVVVAAMVLGGLALLGAVTYFKLWGPLWRDWFTTVDHKKIGIMYIILGIIMLLRGFADAVMMRAQQAISFGANEGYLNAHHYDQIFTAHGVIMIFFVAMGLVVGMMNISVPLQIGARDVAFPLLNSLSFWLFAGAAGLMMLSLVLGEFAATGWMAYPPLSGIQYSPGVGVDYYIWDAIAVISPRICVFETHNIVPTDLSLTIPYSDNSPLI